ncbi:replication initiator protein [Apis mellifera associated microvirus 21]|nr:replication initiator protein [Apis mellifera associated microvirus 21]
MRCRKPKTVGFYSDGKTICWSQKKISKEFATFQLPCGKCLECRLEYARQWAVRCVHEAQMHDENCFITLTYDEQNLKSDKLVYTDFQTFAKNLRTNLFQELLDSIFPNQPQKLQRKLWNEFSKERKDELYNPKKISIFVTGEYGDKKKRPHWHALIFNWRPNDCEYKYSNDRGDKCFSSQTLNDLWPHGVAELGSITFESAGYCARYAAKKLHHGRDGEHPFEPISKKSGKNAIGKSFIAEHWQSIFTHGNIQLPDGKNCSIPRYYEKWLQKHQPEAFKRYVTQKKQQIIEEASARENKIIAEEKEINMKRTFEEGPQISRVKVASTILDQKFKQLLEHLKL